MFGEFPSNFLLQRWDLGRTLSIYMLCWGKFFFTLPHYDQYLTSSLGICVICISAAQNWTHLMVLRGMQGFFECTISPGFLLVIGNWYRCVPSGLNMMKSADQDRSERKNTHPEHFSGNPQMRGSASSLNWLTMALAFMQRSMVAYNHGGVSLYSWAPRHLSVLSFASGFLEVQKRSGG
jgi:MFS family permease